MPKSDQSQSTPVPVNETIEFPRVQPLEGDSSQAECLLCYELNEVEPPSKTIFDGIQEKLQEGMALASDEVIAYSMAILQGIIEGITDLFELVAHPIDNALYPLSLLLFDAAVIAAHHIENPSDEVIKLNAELSQNKSHYFSSMARMRLRLDEIKKSASQFNRSSTLQKTTIISQIATAIFLPGFIFRSAKAMTQAIQNKRVFGSFSHPPKFYSPPDNLPKTRWTPLSFEELRQTSSEHFLYVITEDNQLVIGPTSVASPILHWRTGTPHQLKIFHPMLSELRGVYAAGQIRVEAGLITRIDNASGHFLPQGKQLKDLVEKSFMRAGYSEAVGKFQDIKLLGIGVEQSISQRKDVLQKSFKFTPGVEAFLLALNQVSTTVSPSSMSKEDILRIHVFESTSAIVPVPSAKNLTVSSHQDTLITLNGHMFSSIAALEQGDCMRIRRESTLSTRVQVEFHGRSAKTIFLNKKDSRALLHALTSSPASSPYKDCRAFVADYLGDCAQSLLSLGAKTNGSEKVHPYEAVQPGEVVHFSNQDGVQHWAISLGQGLYISRVGINSPLAVTSRSQLEKFYQTSEMHRLGVKMTQSDQKDSILPELVSEVSEVPNVSPALPFHHVQVLPTFFQRRSDTRPVVLFKSQESPSPNVAAKHVPLEQITKQHQQVFAQAQRMEDARIKTQSEQTAREGAEAQLKQENSLVIAQSTEAVVEQDRVEAIRNSVQVQRVNFREGNASVLSHKSGAREGGSSRGATFSIVRGVSDSLQASLGLFGGKETFQMCLSPDKSEYGARYCSGRDAHSSATQSEGRDGCSIM